MKRVVLKRLVWLFFDPLVCDALVVSRLLRGDPAVKARGPPHFPERKTHCVANTDFVGIQRGSGIQIDRIAFLRNADEHCERRRRTRSKSKAMATRAFHFELWYRVALGCADMFCATGPLRCCAIWPRRSHACAFQGRFSRRAEGCAVPPSTCLQSVVLATSNPLCMVSS